MRASLRSLAQSAPSGGPRGLPPLPPYSTFSSYFKRSEYPKPPDPLIREFRGRILLASRSLCDDFVKAIKLRPGEVVIEVWPGHAQLTRSLLAGGNQQVSSKWTNTDLEVAQKAASTPSMPAPKGAFLTRWQVAIQKIVGGKYPAWSEWLLSDRTSEDRSGQNEDTDLPKPAVVVTVESSPALNVKSLGLPASQLMDDLTEVEENTELPSDGEYEPPVRVIQSGHEARLAICPHTIYRWSTGPAILSHPLVTKHLPEYEEPGEVYGEGRRPWDAPEPHITLTGHIPVGVVGEQLVSQWIGSAIGDSEGRRSWIWQWGRVRMALVMGKGLYDRITAQPRESINCKLSVFAHALFDISPLPPYHHVSNMDKVMSRTEHRAMIDGSIGPPPLTDLRSTTYATDFYPLPFKRGGHDSQPLPRPYLLGLMLTPKKNPVITIEQKDNWDYVLRNCFAREAVPIKVAIKSLGFGAENLLPRIESEGGQWKGKMVDTKKLVRDLEVVEWERLVDVFDKWAFKPDNLILDRLGDDFTREIGQD